jgi:hypothetical protein
MSGHARRVVPWTTHVGTLAAVIGVNKSSLSSLMLWPWLARMRYLDGLSVSWRTRCVGAVAAGSMSVSGKPSTGAGALDDSAGESIAGPTGMSENRCFSFDETSVDSSESVTFKGLIERELSYMILNQHSYQGMCLATPHSKLFRHQEFSTIKVVTYYVVDIYVSSRTQFQTFLFSTVS